jgi:hypothetical protein
MDASDFICFLGINSNTISPTLNQNNMKKKSKSCKAHLTRFILLVIFTVLGAERMYSQCTDSSPAAPCHTNIDFESSCYDDYVVAGDVTDLKSSGLKMVFSVAVIRGADTDITNMTITNILVRAAGCATIDGPYTAATFPSDPTTGYGISFQNNETQVRVFTTSPPPGPGINYAALPIGSHITFVVNASRTSAPTTVSRRYTFQIVAGSYILGDTHVTTVDGVKYDFQAVGEFVALRGEGQNNLDIQTRQTAVATTGPGHDPYSGLVTCVSVNTAVAVRVGQHRVTYQPVDGVPDSTSMELRVDGKLTELGDQPIDLGSGGRVIKSAAGGGAIEIDFPDGTSLAVTPGYWAHYKQWYLNVSVGNTSASKGISGVVPYLDTIPGSTRRLRSWLPSLPDGSNVGPMPQDLHQRFVTLYQTFADAWRVTDQTSLFDYASGKTTADYTNKNWPTENAQTCPVAGQNPKPPIDLATAQQLTIDIVNPILKANAIYDVMITGEATFAQTYLRTQKVQTSTTATNVIVSKETAKPGEEITFTAMVARKYSAGNNVLAGSVEFAVDGNNVGQVSLDANGRATFSTTSLEGGEHKIAARFTPDAGSTVFSSSSNEVTITVIRDAPIYTQWWFWVVLILILIILFFILRKKNP